MMRFETITEYEILRMAQHELLRKWLKEIDIKEEAEKKERKCIIAKIKAERYRKQLDEIENRILEIENNQ